MFESLLKSAIAPLELENLVMLRDEINALKERLAAAKGQDGIRDYIINMELEFIELHQPMIQNMINQLMKSGTKLPDEGGPQP